MLSVVEGDVVELLRYFVSCAAGGTERCLDIRMRNTTAYCACRFHRNEPLWCRVEFGRSDVLHQQAGGAPRGAICRGQQRPFCGNSCHDTDGHVTARNTRRLQPVARICATSLFSRGAATIAGTRCAQRRNRASGR